MGLGTIVLRGLTVITPDWANDLRAALIGDLVGRDSSGAPVAGNNLGNSLFPWGKVFANTIITQDGEIDASQIETQPYQTVSGQTRSGSNQPDFIRASGSGQNFTVLATATPLVLQIAGSSATWTTDRTNAGTLAPSTQNTATVSDATATGQTATRTWGEYGSGSPYYAINLASVGTNISAKVNSWQAFKIGSEYFLAHVESTTSLSRCFRGFFLSSTGAPVPRSTFSNGATITLMSLGWVFCDADGATVDVTYNNPVFSFTAPSSPTSGDYWFDQGNEEWNRYNGSSFILVNRTLVGLIVLDSTNCVASRSFDFFALTRIDNTVELSFYSATVIKGASLFSRVNVNGKRIQFFSSRPKWDTATNLAAPSERYNATVQISSTEYFYVTDQADLKISDMEPYWRPDLLGYYHPFNPWRAEGYDTTDGSANFQASTLFPIKPPLAQQSITTDLIAAAAVSSSNLQTNLNLPGKKVQENGNNLIVSNTNTTNSLAIIRGQIDASGTILSGEGFTVSPSGGTFTISFSTNFADAPAIVAASSLNTTGVIIFSNSNSGFVAHVFNTNTGTGSAQVWHFIAIGQRA